MAAPVFHLRGVRHIPWGERVGHYERPDMAVDFLDSKGRALPYGLDLVGFQIDAWTVQEGIYDGCDEVRVIDQNADGACLEFGRYLIQFIRRGEMTGEETADGVKVRGPANG